jgi:hypothetical protein
LDFAQYIAKIPHLTLDQMYGKTSNLAIDLTQGKIPNLT